MPKELCWGTELEQATYYESCLQSNLGFGLLQSPSQVLIFSELGASLFDSETKPK